MVIKNIEIKNTDPAIIEVTFESLPQNLIDEVYEEKNSFEQLSFENLVVESGRNFYTNDKSKSYRKILKHFISSFEDISMNLFNLDPIRYPIMYYSHRTREESLKRWYRSNNLDKYCSGLLCLDKKDYGQGTHLDNRFAVWAGIINLQDNDFGTYHYKNEFDREPYFIASGKKFVGTFWINTEKTWHGLPKLEKDRRVIVCNQMFLNTGA